MNWIIRMIRRALRLDRLPAGTATIETGEPISLEEIDEIRY